ncbi:mitochondrial import inner membrane translocase subunit TIM14-like [Ostrea edulis]|uniref:mitochondrial import inner membrane translocase subunit TIM14-like n=1 Tax=Ostrea edulis TaxID=37623 RepID=UPI0020943FB2|nr:mitochondrial import inner membrane translocase subunit TIM14-like [Ostrea edulis]
MSSAVILAGLGMAVVGFGGRYLAKHAPAVGATVKKSMDAGLNSGAFSKYYKGGFEAKMSKREAGLVLGVSPSANKARVKEAHKRIMILNHPDKGGSPYLAAKINEAKDMLDGTTKK